MGFLFPLCPFTEISSLLTQNAHSLRQGPLANSDASCSDATPTVRGPGSPQHRLRSWGFPFLTRSPDFHAAFVSKSKALLNRVKVRIQCLGGLDLCPSRKKGQVPVSHRPCHELPSGAPGNRGRPSPQRVSVFSYYVRQ